ncbi:hypothetical protein [Synoicihabitans lomoniglobus]|uniref:Uncharacterized protein n=1 Tax=Synoicihabitans lomoniglobus TaxID=2909285 RepID=A0AAE9ZYG6_9BACT|nr:hypothetical protein [Opitutaceae bacterium LMO-M01]WED65365.1 hypothetical protein PXH66_00695 [Opitutaceae bacterium LMO-M01]
MISIVSIRRLGKLLGLGLLLTGPVLHAASSAPRELGVPVKGVSWTRVHAGATADGEPSILLTMSQNNGGFFVAEVDPVTGHCRQFSPVDRKNSTFSTASFRSLRTGILYIGSAWDAHLHRFDPAHPERGIEDLGKIDDAATFPTGITESPDGSLWIGTYPEARLIRYQPDTGEFTQFGPMHEDENYLYPLAGDDGSVAALVRVIRPHIVVVDPITGEHREVGPAITDTTDESQFIKFFTGVDRRLYLSTHGGDFRVNGMMLEPAPVLPAPLAGIHAAGEHRYQAPVTMPGGWQAHFVDEKFGAPRDLLLTNVDPTVASRRLQLDWKGNGSNVHVIEEGPDGMLYGSSYLPNRLYRAATDGTVVEDLGAHSLAGGQAYSAATFDGKVYLASYPGSRLSVYDPNRPLRFGTEPSDNPRDLGRLDHIGYRPNAMIATPRGKLWMASGPAYGLVGGTLAWYEPGTGASESHRSIVEGLSPASLLWLPGTERLLVGMSVEVGTGADVVRTDATWALWDPEKDELVWADDFGIEDMADVVSLAPAGNGLVYALIGRGDHILTAGGEPIGVRLALIDPAARKLIGITWLPKDFGPLAWHGADALRISERGNIYGVTANCVYRIAPGTVDVERVWQLDDPVLREGVWLTSLTPNAIDIVGPIIGNELFFATGWKLRAITLPE